MVNYKSRFRFKYSLISKYNKLRFLLLVISLSLLFLSFIVFSLGDKQIPASILGGSEINSPSDWVKENQIQVFKNKIVINVRNASWAGFTDTNSMDPFIDDSANAIEIEPDNSSMIQVGDVISYKSDIGIVIHRVIEKGEDNKGVYFIVKGDNNRLSDPKKVRFEDIVGVVVAVIY